MLRKKFSNVSAFGFGVKSFLARRIKELSFEDENRIYMKIKSFFNANEILRILIEKMTLKTETVENIWVLALSFNLLTRKLEFIRFSRMVSIWKLYKNQREIAA